MKRRDFVNATLAGSAALSLPGAAVGASKRKPPPDIPAVRLSGEATVLERAALREVAGDASAPTNTKICHGENIARLAKLKHKYDPGNLLRLNSNIPPVA